MEILTLFHRQIGEIEEKSERVMKSSLEVMKKQTERQKNISKGFKLDFSVQSSFFHPFSRTEFARGELCGVFLWTAQNDTSNGERKFKGSVVSLPQAINGRVLLKNA